jgi:predicted amidohydrolase YtcJ
VDDDTDDAPMSDRSADLVLRGGSVQTMDAARRWARAIAVRGGRIATVGMDDDVAAAIGPRTRVVELRGRTVLPGFGDAHVHPVTSGVGMAKCDLHSRHGREAALAHVRWYADAHPDLEWIDGEGWAMADYPGGTPRREDLDAIVPDRPVLLYNRDGHGAWVNSRALELAGLTAQTPDPPDGRIERDPDGSPSGTLHEGAIRLVADLLPADTAAQVYEGLLRAQAHLHGLGVTSWQDAAVDGPVHDAYLRAAERGELTARVVGALRWRSRSGRDQIDELLDRRRSATEGRYRATSIKFFQDGVVENFEAGMLEPYLGPDGLPTADRGRSFVDPDELKSHVSALDAAGFQVHFHAIGDRAVRESLDAIEAARAVNGPTDGRHHVAHLQVVHRDDIPRFRRLGAIANAQPLWAVSEPQMELLTIPFLGPERAARQYPFGSLLRAGAMVAMGSDWAVSTPDVMLQAEVAVERVWPPHRGAKEPFLPDERIGLLDALHAFTMGTAYVNHLEHEIGSIEAGKAADLVILDRDVFDRGAGPIGDARVLATFIDGRSVYEVPALEG